MWPAIAETTKHEPMCLIHNKAKQYQTTGVWNRERFIECHVGRWVAHTLKNPKLPKQLLELINELNKVAGYKINIQKSIAFLYNHNEISEKK